MTVPGAIDGFCQLSETHGKLGLDSILQPAIQYFDNGVPIAPRVAFDYEQASKVLNPAGRRH